ncbi:MAG: leucine-rich repeat domain-containing protein, partial [Candidatus Margulisiibacteriota bacterium]
MGIIARIGGRVERWINSQRPRLNVKPPTASITPTSQIYRVQPEGMIPKISKPIDQIFSIDYKFVSSKDAARITNDDLLLLVRYLIDSKISVSLEHLELRGAQVSDLSPLAGLTNLEWLDLSGTQVSDLSPLAGLTNLEWLDLTGTQVSDLSPLAGLTQLEDLLLTDTQVSDLSPLAGLTQLEDLLLTDTQVSDLSPLAGL